MSNNETKPVLNAIYNWWRELHDKRHRGARAELRRCRNPLDAVFQPAFRDLLDKLAEAVPGYIDRPRNRDRLALIAALLAHVRESSEEPVPAAMARGSGGTRGLSPLRFRRVVSHERTSDLFQPMLRAVKQLKGRVNVHGLASALLYWNEKLRRDWAYRYYSARDETPGKT